MSGQQREGHLWSGGNDLRHDLVLEHDFERANVDHRHSPSTGVNTSVTIASATLRIMMSNGT